MSEALSPPHFTSRTSYESRPLTPAGYPSGEAEVPGGNHRAELGNKTLHFGSSLRNSMGLTNKEGQSLNPALKSQSPWYSVQFAHRL